MMKIDCSRQVWAKRTDGHTLAFLGLLVGAKNSNSFHVSFSTIQISILQGDKILMDEETGESYVTPREALRRRELYMLWLTRYVIGQYWSCDLSTDL